MTEMQVLPGLHSCKREMEMRILKLEETEHIWCVYGVCKTCEEVVVSALFQQPEEPVQDRDFMVDFTKVTKVRRSHKL